MLQLRYPRYAPAQQWNLIIYVFFKLEKVIIAELFITYLLFPEFLKNNKKHFQILDLEEKV